MQARKKAQLNELIQQHFQQERQLAIQLILSLDDISLRNIQFVDFMEDFAANSAGLSRNSEKLATLTTAQLYIIEQFLHYIQLQCPTCYCQNIETGLHTIQAMIQHKKLVS